MQKDHIKPSTNFRPHDLLWIGGAKNIVTDTYLPGWVSQILDEDAVVVVRRSPCTDGLVPVGIRGRARNERFAAAVPAGCIEKVIAPEQLRERNISPTPQRRADIPALRWFFEAANAWAGETFPWGPAGSVGFELATGMAMATPSSDLDLVMRSESPMPRSVAMALLASLKTTGGIDIQVEAPAGSFSLREFIDARSSQVLVKTLNGPRLVNDPWKKEPWGKEQGEFE